MQPVASACLDEDSLLALIERRLSPDARLRAERHVDGCEDCRRVVAALAPDVAVGSSPHASAAALGDDLAALVRSRDISPAFAKDVSLQLVELVAEAHRARSVHGGLAPEHVRVDLAGQVRLASFSPAGPDEERARRADTEAVSRMCLVLLERAGIAGGALRAVFEHAAADSTAFGSALDLERAVQRATGRSLPDTAWIPGPGEIIGSKYRALGVLGTGGMGVVMNAMQIDLGRRVAIKLMPPRAARRPAAVERFLREARAASAIENDHVVRIFDVGRSAVGVPYMVMEHLDGMTLGKLSAMRGPLPVHEAIDYVLQASVAIAECHARGIVHRDLKPDNVMVLERPGQRGFVKVLDFGVSKADWVEGPDPPRLTDTMEMLGTPTYMSPEQIRSSKTVDVRTDIWALGVILYELIAGRPPFSAPNVPALSAMIVSDDPIPLCRLRSDVPPELELVVRRCLEKRADRRPSSIVHLAELLVPFASPVSLPSVERIRGIVAADLPRVSSIPPPPGSSPVASATPLRPPPPVVPSSVGLSTDSLWQDAPLRRVKPRTLALGVIGVLALATLGALGWTLVSNTSLSGGREPVASAPAAAPNEHRPLATPQPAASESLIPATTHPEETEPSSEPDAGSKRSRRWRGKSRGPLDERH